MKKNLKKSPRGIRNNNPLNVIRLRGTVWRGQREVQTDSRFVQFKSMTMGYRAAFKVLQNYHVRHDCFTLRQYIQRWAPESENNTKMYVKNVANYAKVRPDQVLPSPRKAKNIWVQIVAGMHRVECGTMPSIRLIEDGWQLAFGEI